MTLTKLISNHASPVDSLVVTRHPELVQPAKGVKPERNSCRSHLYRVVQQIESPEVREITDRVFQDLLRLLECLDLIESHLRQVDAAEHTFTLFQLIHNDARSLIEFIRVDALGSKEMSEELADTLDGITFAVNHDLRRVFESDPGLPVSDKAAHVVLGKLYRAHDVLTNCLQQSTTTLAMVYDPELSSAKLFNNSDMRYRQSLQLCQDLSTLIQLIESFEGIETQSAVSTLIAGIEKFRNESMELLLYSDWPQFETFCERIELFRIDFPQLEMVLHQFRCYLETLLAQVRMRAVLANGYTLSFGENDAEMPNAFGENVLPFCSVLDVADDKTEWPTLALAV